METMLQCGKGTQSLYKAMQRGGSQHWEVKNSTGLVVVFHLDAEQEFVSLLCMTELNK